MELLTSRPMLRSRWLRVFRSLGLEFWLLLPVLGVAFWLGSGFLTDRMLSRVYEITNPLEIKKRQEKKPSKVVESISIEMDQKQGLAKVNVKTVHSTLKGMQFEFPVNEPEQIEAEISRELGLPRDRVRELVKYQPPSESP